MGRHWPSQLTSESGFDAEIRQWSSSTYSTSFLSRLRHIIRRSLIPFPHRVEHSVSSNDSHLKLFSQQHDCTIQSRYSPFSIPCSLFSKKNWPKSQQNMPLLQWGILAKLNISPRFFLAVVSQYEISYFLTQLSLISPSIKSIFNDSNITFHMQVSQLPSQLSHHHQHCTFNCHVITRA